MQGIETLILDIIFRVYDAIGWPGVVFLMAVESAAETLGVRRQLIRLTSRVSPGANATGRTFIPSFSNQ